jgi:hypothetical protein
MKRKATYRRPALTAYTREDLLEWMGPVKTQYVEPCVSCQVELSQDQFLQVKPDQSLVLTVDTGGCPTFEQVRVEIPGEAPAVYDRADGAMVGGDWSLAVTGLQFVIAPGSYPVTVTLINEDGSESSSCSSLIDVIL